MLISPSQSVQIATAIHRPLAKKQKNFSTQICICPDCSLYCGQIKLQTSGEVSLQQPKDQAPRICTRGTRRITRFQRNVSNSLFYKTFHRRRRRHYRKLTKTLHPKISSREIRAGCQDQRILHVQGSSVSFHDCVCGYILGRSERLE
jgi:hypothetical protein